MKRLFSSLLSLLLLATFALPAQAATLKAGDSAPDFTLQGSLNGKDFTFALQDALAKGPVVIYFFPSAFTQGCDLEAHTFATQMDKFKAAGASVIGVSADSIERLHDFSKDPEFCAGAFPVASDTNGKVAASYGLTPITAKTGMTDVRGADVAHPLIPRTTFVLAKSGKLVTRMSSAEDGLTPIDHVEKSLAIVTRLQAQ